MENVETVPPEPKPPTCCCGRGCEHCVWISFFEAQNRWRDLYSKDNKTVDNE